MTLLKDRVAIVTGGGTRIGRGVALALAEQGSKVVVCGRRPDRLEQTVRSIQGLGGEALAFQKGQVKEELESLSEHLKHSGTRTGEQVREALQQLASGVKAGSAAGRAGLSESASTATERLSQAASGVLAALSESLKRQSERLRS